MKEPRGQHAPLTPDQRRLFALLLEKEGIQGARDDRIPRRKQTEAPLSFSQQRLWFLNQLSPGDPAYNISTIAWMEGDLDVEALERALTEIVRRHEALRTVFPSDNGRPRQRVRSPQSVPLDVVDLGAVPAAGRRTAVRRHAMEDARRAFDLGRGPLVRVTLLRLSERLHALLLTMHHIVSDGWSVGVLIRELGRLYVDYRERGDAALEEPPIQYADFAAWQRERLQGPFLDSQLSYWKQVLQDAPPVLELPADRPRAPLQTHRGALEPFTWPAELSDRLRAFCQRQDATVFMVLLAAFQLLLQRYTGRDDVIVGSPIANRTRPETEGLIGFFVNTLVLRTDLTGDPSFVELVGRVRETTLGAYAHQDLPFELLVEELGPERHLSQTPLFQVLFTFQNSPMPELGLPDLAVELEHVETGAAMFDLSLTAFDAKDGLRGSIDYSTDLFEADTIARLVRHLRNLLESLLAGPERRISEAQLLDGEERRRLLAQASGATVAYPSGRCVHHLFEEQAARTPDAVAVVAGGCEGEEDRRLTYRELDGRASRLARELRSSGVGPGVRVGICVERSPELAVALLGTLKAGGAYVALDVAAPRSWRRFMLDDAGVAILLTQRSLAADASDLGPVKVLYLDEQPEAANPDDAPTPDTGVAPDDLAYVGYTSGSTGKPKGVMIPHRGLVNHALAIVQRFGLRAADRLLQFRSVAFDVAAEELFPGWLCGATAVFWPDRLAPDLNNFVSFVERQRLTVVNLPSSYWHQWVSGCSRSESRVPDSLRSVIVGSEATLADALASWQELIGDGVEWRNCYGVTEATITSTIYEPDSGGRRSKQASVPIGGPISNVRVHVLDRWLRPAGVGVPGELYIGGAGLARGYLGRPGLTAGSFLPDPFSESGGRLYRTGDRARWSPGGDLELQGRVDEQVQIRGFRVEPQQVEAVLAEHSGIRQCAVVDRPDRQGAASLVAYFVPHGPAPPALGELRAFLGARLPDYMVPRAFVPLQSMPVTPNGKLDRKALPAPESGLRGVTVRKGARTSVEETLLAIWSDVLGVQDLGVNESFFDLGGHSLSAIQVVSRVNEALDVVLPLTELFRHPTIEELAHRIETDTAGRGVAAPPMVRVPRSRKLVTSLPQAKLLALERSMPPNPLHNIPVAIRLTGTLSLDALERSVNALVERHEGLRTAFAIQNGQPYQVVLPSLTVRPAIEDLSGLPAAERDARVDRLVAEEAFRPFDLFEAPLLRVGLLRLGADEHVLLVTVHHIIADGWSMEILFHDLEALYASAVTGQDPMLPELPHQYVDFAAWQRRGIGKPYFESQVEYWAERLGPRLPPQELPADRPRPESPTFNVAHHDLVIPKDLTAAIRGFAAGENASLFMVMLAIFKLMLFRRTGQPDLAVGVLVVNRPRAAMERVIGLFVNTVVLRTDLSGDPSFRALASRVRQGALDAFSHSDVPLETVLDRLEAERGQLDRASLFRVLFVWENAWKRTSRFHGLDARYLERQPLRELGLSLTRCDLIVTLGESEQGIAGSVAYQSDIFDAETVAEMWGRFSRLARLAVEQPERRLHAFPEDPPTADRMEDRMGK